LTKILGQMGNDIGKFDEKTGEVKFDPVDADRLEMVSKATGLSVDSLMDKITKSKRDAKKENLLGSLFGQLDDKQKEFVQQFTEIGENGEITMTGALQGLSVEELKNMSQNDIKKKMEIAESEKKDLEKRAKDNESFKEALSNFSTVLLNFFTIFQPILAFFGTILKFLTDYKYVTMSLIAAFVAFQAFAKAELIGKFIGGMRGMFGGGGGIKSVFSGASERFSKGLTGGGETGGKAPDLNLPDDKKIKSFSQPKLGTQIKQTLKGIADGVKEFGKVSLKDVGMLIASAAGLVVLTPAIPTLLLLQFIKGNSIKSALKGIADGFVAMGKAFQSGSQFIPFIFLAELALAGFGVALIPLTYALSLLSPLVDSFGKIIIGVFSAIPPIISSMAEGIATIASGFGNLIMNLAPLAPSLFLLGPGFLVAAAGLAAFTLAALAFGISSIFFGSAFKELTNLAMLGPMLAEGGKGINAMAEGVEKLSSALSSISDDTLDKLKAIGESVGDAAALTAAVNALTVVTGGGGKGGATQNFQIEVIVKNENGREIQRKILKDTDLLK
jgi:hypothetical protein